MHPLGGGNSTDISESTYHLEVRERERDWLYRCESFTVTNANIKRMSKHRQGQPGHKAPSKGQ